MHHVRHQRVRELLKRQLGEIIRREIPATGATLVTVNDVELAGDLKSATVFVGVIGTEKVRKQTVQALNEQRVRIQELVAHAVVLRHTPRLRFELDTSVERGNRVLSILREIEEQPPQNPK
jgi:ribosome-binding factor A